jgi:hypothetical protein
MAAKERQNGDTMEPGAALVPHHVGRHEKAPELLVPGLPSGPGAGIRTGN